MRSKRLLVAVTGAALLVPAAAQAHVTINPSEAPAGGFTQLDVRVPNERDNASTVKVDLKLPDGFAFASYEPKPGWSVKVYKSKLSKPVQTDDGPVDEQVSRIVWTGSGKGVGKIGPGEFANFPLSVQVPGKAGDTLTFKALQTYSDGEVVRWIGDESSDTPAPTVKAVAAAGGAADQAAPSATPAASQPASGSDDSGSDGLAIAALIVGIVALVAAGAAALAGRRRVGATV
jgi:uncharacterized protein